MAPHPKPEPAEDEQATTGTFERSIFDGLDDLPSEVPENDGDSPEDDEPVVVYLSGSDLRGDPERWVSLGRRRRLKECG